MKKCLCLCMLFSVCFLTGCTKNYKTVDEYISAMNIVKNKNASHTIEAKYNTGTVEMYYKAYFKGNKWKFEMSMNGGSSYMQTTLYDGVDILSYTQGSQDAVSVPMTELAQGAEAQIVINNTNPVHVLYDWSRTILEMDSHITPVFENQKAEKNGVQCRLIKFGTEREACVDDKSGLAVYNKLTLEDPAKKGNMMTHEMNLVKVDYTDIPDSTFQLPPGIKKTSFDKMLDDMDKSMKKHQADNERLMEKSKQEDGYQGNFTNSSDDYEDEPDDEYSDDE